MLEQLGHALEAADAAAVIATMAEDVTLRVAVHDEPFEGLPAATQILGAVLDGALHDIEVLQTIDGHDGAVRQSPWRRPDNAILGRATQRERRRTW